MMVGRLALELDGRPIDLSADERGVELHVRQPLRSARGLRRTLRALTLARGRAAGLDREWLAAVPVRVRLGPLPAFRWRAGRASAASAEGARTT